MSESLPSPSELDEFDRSLLGSAHRDGPLPGAVTRTAAALGLGLTAATPLAAASSAGLAARAFGLTGAKWTLIGALGVIGAGTGTVAYLGASAHDPVDPLTSPAAAAPRTAGGTPGAVAATPPAPNADPAVTTGEKPAAPPATPRPGEPAALLGGSPASVPAAPALAPAAPAGQVAATTGTQPVSIAEEVAVVDRARQALRQGHAGEAFDELNRYQSRWPSGVLATEVVVLRVEAELRLGDRAGAKRDARAFIATQPASRYAARLRELFEPGELD